jgi:hypothetical protein
MHVDAERAAVELRCPQLDEMDESHFQSRVWTYFSTAAKVLCPSGAAFAELKRDDSSVEVPAEIWMNCSIALH